MNHWAFVTAAYVVTILAVALLLVWAALSMRSAEARAKQLRDSK